MYVEVPEDVVGPNSTDNERTRYFYDYHRDDLEKRQFSTLSSGYSTISKS